VNDSTIVISKGKERWEIARDAATKINGDIKIGSRSPSSTHNGCRYRRRKTDKPAAKVETDQEQ